MNPGDKVRILKGIYKGAIGILEEYRKLSKDATPFCKVHIPSLNCYAAVDAWDLEPDPEEELNEADATSASNM